MSFICWRWMCMPLTNTASAHSKSSSVAGRRFSSTKRTCQLLRQIGRDHQQALRRHEGLDAIGQGIGIFERAEGRRVARKDAQNAADRLDALNSHQTSSAIFQSGKRHVRASDLITRGNAEPEIPQYCGSPANLKTSHWLLRFEVWKCLDQSVVTQNRATARHCRQGGSSASASPACTSQSSNSGARLRPKRSRT